MSSEPPVDRRRFLRYSATTTASVSMFGLSGCFHDDNDDDEVVDDDEPEDDIDDDIDDDVNDDPPWVDEEDLEVSVTQNAVPESIDPITVVDQTGINVIRQVYEPVVDLDADGMPISRLATDWERETETTIRLDIREDVQFHSGSTMAPSDVVFSLERAIDTEESLVSDWIGDIDSVSEENGDVLIELNTVTPMIFRTLGVYGYVLEEDWVDDHDGEIDTDANGTGPYELASFEPGGHAEFERFDDYWSDIPDPDGGRFDRIPDASARSDALVSLETDLVTNVPPATLDSFEISPFSYGDTVDSVVSVFLAMDHEQSPFDSLEFRQALNHAVDTDSIVDDVLDEFGTPTGQLTPPDHTGYDPDIEPYQFDPETAESLIEESGHSGEELTLVVPEGRFVGDGAVGEAVVASIDGLDSVSCSIEIMDFPELARSVFDDEEDAPEFFLYGWSNPTRDAEHALWPWVMEGPSQQVDDEEVAELLESANDLADDQERTDLLMDANAHLHDGAAMVFLHRETGTYGISERLEWSPRSDGLVLLEEISEQV